MLNRQPLSVGKLLSIGAGLWLVCVLIAAVSVETWRLVADNGNSRFTAFYFSSLPSPAVQQTAQQGNQQPRATMDVRVGVAIANKEGKDLEYTVVATDRNREISRTPEIQVPSGQTREVTVDLVLPANTDSSVTFSLLRSGDARAYRSISWAFRRPG